MRVEFAFYKLGLHFEALTPIHFPPGLAGNVLRGGFGTIFRRLACGPHCASAKTCELRDVCPYARTFEPRSNAGPSGLFEQPRPFVFRAAHLDGRTLQPGEPFHFGVHLFQLEDAVIPQFVATFSELAGEGFGPGRGRARLARNDVVSSSLSLQPAESSIQRVRIRFVTPIELKGGNHVAGIPDFHTLACRIRDRISNLSALYGAGPLRIDFAAFGQRAAKVRLVTSETAPVHVTRLSTRTGQRHPLDGFVGWAEYAGELSEFVPFLAAAQFTGVGRQTAWGKGEIAVHLGCATSDCKDPSVF